MVIDMQAYGAKERRTDMENSPSKTEAFTEANFSTINCMDKDNTIGIRRRVTRDSGFIIK
jgi:hypothetical protein